MLLVGTLLPWRVVDGDANASVNGLYNFVGGADNHSYLGPNVLFLAFVMLASSVATLVLVGLRSKGTRLAVALAAGLSVLLGIGVWRLADTNRRMVVDPGDYDLSWFGGGQQKVGSGLQMVLATSEAVIVTGAISLCLVLLALTRWAAHDGT